MQAMWSFRIRWSRWRSSKCDHGQWNIHTTSLVSLKSFPAGQEGCDSVVFISAESGLNMFLKMLFCRCSVTWESQILGLNTQRRWETCHLDSSCCMSSPSLVYLHFGASHCHFCVHTVRPKWAFGPFFPQTQEEKIREALVIGDWTNFEKAFQAMLEPWTTPRAVRWWQEGQTCKQSLSACYLFCFKQGSCSRIRAIPSWSAFGVKSPLWWRRGGQAWHIFDAWILPPGTACEGHGMLEEKGGTWTCWNGEDVQWGFERKMRNMKMLNTETAFPSLRSLVALTLHKRYKIIIILLWKFQKLFLT